MIVEWLKFVIARKKNWGEGNIIIMCNIIFLHFWIILKMSLITS